MSFLLSHYISDVGLRNLDYYKYNGVDNSLVAKHVMQPFWIKAVTWLPVWMAPNLVTLTGFFFILASYAATYYYHPDIVGKGPQWLYFFNALCMFVYQTMDALDGKQARRTGASSPLGELFDHGCDAVTTVVGTLTLGSTLGADKTLLLATLALMMTAFYFTQWEEYYTGTLTLGYIGVTEAQIGAMGIYLLTGILGPEWWLNVFHVAGWKVYYGGIPLLVSAASMIPTTISNVKVVIDYHRKEKPQHGLFNAFFNTTPVVVVNIGFLMWAYRSSIYFAHPHVFLLAYGFLVSNFVGRIVLDRVCIVQFLPLQPLLIPLGLLPFALHTRAEVPLLYAYCSLAVFSYFQFALSVIRDLCVTLKINCLSLGKLKS